MIFWLACQHRPPEPPARVEPTWFDVEPGKPLCVSRFPDAGPIPEAVRFDAAVELLVRGELAAAVAALQALPPEHPAVQGALAVVGLLVGQPEASAELARLADEHPGDPCALVDGALAAAASGDPRGAATRVLNARAIAPQDANVALLSWLLDLEPSEALLPVLEAGLAAAPSSPGLALAVGLEKLRAQDPAGVGLLETAVENGVGDAAGTLLVAYRATGRRADYLRLASKLGLLFDDGRVNAAEDAEDAFATLVGQGPGEVLRVTLHTSMGGLRCTLLPDVAPLTVATFVGLARGSIPWLDPRDGTKQEVPLYDGTVFHRVIPEFMVQGGDPLGTGQGGPGWSLPDEVDAAVRFDAPGVLAMANHGPNTSGSQFFVTEVAVAHLDGRYTIFGRCDDAAVEVVRRIARVDRDPEDMPLAPVVLERVEVQSAP